MISSKTSGPTPSRHLTALVTVGSAGVSMSQSCRASLLDEYGVVPPFIRMLALDTTEQSARKVPPLPDESFMSFGVSDLTALLRREGRRRKELGLPLVGNEGPTASGSGAGGEAYLAGLMLAHRLPEVRAGLVRLLEPFAPGAVADLAARCARDPVLQRHGIVVSSKPRAIVLFAASTPGGSSGVDQQLLALMRVTAASLGIEVEIHSLNLLPEVN